MKEKIAEDLRRLGINEGDTVHIHTAFSKLGKGAKPDDVIDALISVVGESGNIMFPAFSWETVTREEPVFDVKNTVSCVGFLPEYVRTNRTDFIRSVHPTHSLSIRGKLAEELVKAHKNDRTPVGENSPLRAISKLKNGKILFLGCETEPNTSMHGVEELVKPDYLFGDDIEYTLSDYDGKPYKVVYHPHGFKNTVQRYERMEGLLNQYEMSKGKVLNADCVLMLSSAVWAKGEEALKQNNHYFVDILG